MRRANRARPAASLVLALAALPELGSPALAQADIGGEPAYGAVGGLTGPAPAGTGLSGSGLSGSGAAVVPGGGPVVPGEAPVRLGGFFGFPYGGPAPLGGTAPARSWIVQPGIGVQLFATDNAFQGSNGEKQADLVTSVTPDLLVVGDTARLQTRFRYAPSLRVYASGSEQDRVDHRFNGSAVATLLPGSVYLDLRASAAVLPIAGNQAASDEATLPRNNRTQTFNVAFSPYYIQRYGGLATSLLGYTFQHSSLGGSTARLTPEGLPFFTSQDLTSHTGFAALRSGEDFGPLAAEARLTGTSYTGGGVLDGAHRALAIVETRYAFTRAVAGLVEGGYEDQEYGGLRPVRISEPVWGVGVRLDLGPRTLITARYRRRDGFNAPRLDARMGIGARTSLYASYADQLTTFVRFGADLLSQTSVDELGNPIDTQTGAPARDVTSGGLLSTQNGLFRARRAILGISQAWDRDIVSLDLSRDERIPVSIQVGTTAFQQTSYGVGTTWAHLLSALTTLTASARYGRTQSSDRGPEGDTYAFRATLVHRFDEKLVGSLQYLLTNRSTDLVDPTGLSRSSTLQNALIASLRRTF